jgi:hypothetical protein
MKDIQDFSFLLVLKPLYSILKIEMEIAILFDKTNVRLKKEADSLAQALKSVAAGQIRLRYVDPLEPPVPVDLSIHLEVPIYVWMPWSTVSVLYVNMEKYEKEEWNGYVPHFEAFLFSTSDAKETFEGLYPNQKTWVFSKEAFAPIWSDLKVLLKEKKPLKVKHLPPVLQPTDCPPISIVTLLYNRRKFFDLACHNIMLSDYPKGKIEWIIIEDSDDPNQDASDKVVQVGLKSAPLTVVYIPLEKKTPIGQKRNIGIERAKNDIILFMDDDDHYPETSFRRRVSWLTKHPWGPKATVCTTIACYDLIRGVSSVNTPPWNLSLGKRVSEATLTFYKSWWAEQKFPEENLSEGDKFLEGREQDVLELPPQQVIVAFTHSKNTSGRRIPSGDIKPGCFWGFPKEYLIYIHRLVGMEIEEER